MIEIVFWDFENCCEGYFEVFLFNQNHKNVQNYSDYYEHQCCWWLWVKCWWILTESLVSIIKNNFSNRQVIDR